MAKTIYLPDGGMTTIFTGEDFFEPIESHAGHDAAQLVRNLANELKPEKVNQIICKGEHL